MVVVNEELRIILNSVFQGSGFKAAQNQLNQIQKAVQRTNKRLQGFRGLQQVGRNTQQIEQANEFLDQFGAKLGQSGRIIQKDFGQNAKAVGKITASLGTSIRNTGMTVGNLEQQLTVSQSTLKNISANMGEFDKQMQSARQTGSRMGQMFSFEFLSIMFAGMALQRTFGRIQKATVSTFMDVTEGATRAGRGMNQLKGGFKAVQFIIGELIAKAIQPFLPMIMNAINSFIQWVDENEELAKVLAGLIPVLTAVGGAMTVLGQVILGKEGIALAMAKYGSSADDAAAATQNAADTASSAKPKISGLRKALGAIAAVYTIKLTADFIGTLAKKDNTLGESIADAIKTSIGFGATAGFFKGVKAGVLTFAVTAAISIGASIIDVEMDKNMKGAFRKARKNIQETTFTSLNDAFTKAQNQVIAAQASFNEKLSKSFIGRTVGRTVQFGKGLLGKTKQQQLSERIGEIRKEFQADLISRGEAERQLEQVLQTEIRLRKQNNKKLKEEQRKRGSSRKTSDRNFVRNPADHYMGVNTSGGI